MNKLARLILTFFVTLSASLCGEVLKLELPGTQHPVPIKIYLPDDASLAAPVVLFSHGLGGSREGATYLGEHWSKANYAVIALQHPGSDDSVWKDLPKRKAYRALKKAASGRSFMGHIHDIQVVLDWLQQSSEAAAHPLYLLVDTERIGKAGHSFGTVTTQAMIGQSFRNPGDRPFADSRISCFILIFHQGGHSIFSGFRGTDHHYHAAIEAITTGFLDAYLKQDAAALTRLRGGGVRTSLKPEDLWEWKWVGLYKA